MTGVGKQLFEGKFNVAGTSFRTDDVVEMIKFIYQSGSALPYGGHSARDLREILEDGEPYYKYRWYETDDISFVPEPDNEYDPDAILVVVGGHIEIGYVPKDYLTLIRNALDREDVKIDVTASIMGGPYKKLDFIKDKVVTEQNPHLGVQLKVTISEITDEEVEPITPQPQLVAQPQQEANYNSIGCGCCLLIVIVVIFVFIDSILRLF